MGATWNRERLAGIARRAADWSSVALILAVAWYGIFDLPYSFPPEEPTAFSPSFNLGFGNRVAVLTVVATIGVFCLRNWIWRQATPEPVDTIFQAVSETRPTRLPSMPKSVLLLFVGIYIGLTSLLYVCIPRLDEYGETLCLLPRLELAYRFGLQLYRDIDWAFGPALFYLPQLFFVIGSFCGVSLDFSYLLCFEFVSILSLCALFYVVDLLRIKVAHRILVFSLLAIGGFNLTLGLQYLFLRYVISYATLLAFHRVSTRWASLNEPRAIFRLCGIALACALVPLSVSPEFGIAYVIAQVAYCAHRAVFVNRSWLYLILTTIVAFLIWLLAFPNCLRLFMAYTKGGANFPVVPSVYMLIYLLSLFWLLPILGRVCVSRRPGVHVPLVLAWGVLVVATIPPSLGRCDVIHVFFNGLGAFLLTLVVLAKHRPRLFPGYAIFFLLAYGIAARVCEVVCYANYLAPVRLALAGKRVQPDTPQSPLVDSLGLKKFSSVAMPLGADRATKCYLIETGRYLTQYYPDYVTVVSKADLERKIQDLDKASVVVVPGWVPELRGMSDDAIQKLVEGETKESDEQQGLMMGVWLLYPIDFKTKHPPFEAMLAEARYIAANYKPVRRAAGWVLMVPDSVDAGPAASVSDTPESPMTPEERAAARAASK